MVQLANETFGFDGWGYSVTNQTVDFVDHLAGQSKQQVLTNLSHSVYLFSFSICGSLALIQVFSPRPYENELPQLMQNRPNSLPGKFSVGVSATVKVTLKNGCFREDVGYGCVDGMR